MIAVVPSPVRDLPAQMRARAKVRRIDTPDDAVATSLEANAAELERAIADGLAETRLVGTKEFAKIRGVLPSTVRKWCGRGELPGAHLNDAGDWTIPASARRTPKVKA